MREGLPSDSLKGFLNFLRVCQQTYQKSSSEVWKHDKKQQDQLHDLEFANDYAERCKIATRIHQERMERRECKDRAMIVEEIAKFCADKQNKQFLERLKGLLEKQLAKEEFLMGERHYNRRVVEEDVSNRGQRAAGQKT